jgi:hypothetical protein
MSSDLFEIFNWHILDAKAVQFIDDPKFIDFMNDLRNSMKIINLKIEQLTKMFEVFSNQLQSYNSDNLSVNEVV